jgi:hypothetical protein
MDELVGGRGRTNVLVLTLAVHVARSLKGPHQTQLLAVDFRLLHSSARLQDGDVGGSNLSTAS